MTSLNRPEWRALLLAAEEMVRREWHADPGDAVAPGNDGMATTALDRIAQMGAVALDNSLERELIAVVESFVQLYGDAEGPRNGRRRRAIAPDQHARRGFEVTSRVYTIGALAVYDKQYEIVPRLVLQHGDGDTSRSLWLRDTLTQLARSGQLERKSLIPFVAEQIFQRAPLFARFRGVKDDVVNALCRFDFLQCVLATGHEHDIHACYPNFGGYHNDRTEPIIEELVTRGPARSALGDMSDAELANIIQQLDNLAGTLFFEYSGWSSGWWERGSIREFLRTHLAPPKG